MSGDGTSSGRLGRRALLRSGAVAGLGLGTGLGPLGSVEKAGAAASEPTSPLVRYSEQVSPESGAGGHFKAVARRSDGDAVAVGTIDTEDRTADAGWVVGFDDTGGLRWRRSFDDSTDRKDRLFDIVGRDDGGFFTVGQTRPTGAVDGLALAVENDGSFGVRSRFGTDAGNTFQALDRNGQGGYVAGGAYNDGRGEDAQSESWDGRLAFIERDATVTSFSQRSRSGADWITDLTRTPHGDLVGVGGIFGGVNDGNYVVDGWYFQTNPDGETDWSYYWDNGGYDLFEAVTATADGGFLTVGHTETNGAAPHSGWVIKFDPQGQKVWEREIGGANNDSLHGVIQTDDGQIIAVGEYGASETATYAFSGVRPPRRPPSGDAWIVVLGPDGEVRKRLTFSENGGADRLLDVIEADDGGYLGVGHAATGDADEAWVVEFEPRQRTNPFADFSYDPAFPSPGATVSLDASDAFAENGSITGYEWTTDGDEEYELTGRVTTTSFASPGDYPVTLRVTAEGGTTDTNTQTVRVRRDKLQLAAAIDDRSVVSVIEDSFGVDVYGDTEMTRETIDSLNAAVEDGRVDRQVADEAIRRLRATERGMLRIVNRMGPSTPVTPGVDGEYNLAELIARTLLQFVVKLVFIAVAVAAVLASGAGGLAAVALGAAVSLLSDIPSWFIGTLLGNDGTDVGVHLQDRIERRLQEESGGVVGKIRQGIISTPEGVLAALDGIADGLVDTLALGIRGIVDLRSSVYTFGDGLTGLTGGAFMAGGSPTTSVYQGLRSVDDAMQPDQIEDGLQGSTAGGVYAVDNITATLDATIQEAVANIEGFSGIDSELNILDVLIDALQGEGGLQNARQLATRFLSAFAGSVVEALFSLISVGISGGLLLRILYDIDRIATSAITGQEVDPLD